MLSPFQATLNHIISRSKGLSERGALFEHLIKQFFENDGHYRHEIKEVWRWNNWPDKPNQDRGVDLVVHTINDEYWAVQCKCYSPGSVVNKPGIDSFISQAGIEFETESGRKSFARRYLVMTGNLGSGAQQTINDQKDTVTVLNSDILDQSLIVWPRFTEAMDNSIRIAKPNELHPYQEDAIQDVIEKFQTADRGQLIMACGTGKTFTSLRLAELLPGPGGCVLFLAPSISLVSQAMREWTAHSKIVSPFVVCSDINVGKGSRVNEDMRIAELAIPPTTDPEKLSRSFADPEPSRLNVIFSTYHSIDVIHQAQSKHGMPAFDLVVCDEAHRTAGVSMLADGVAEYDEESFFVRIHNSDYIQAKKQLYMTATPRIYNSESKIKAANMANEALLYSMDDDKHFGEEFHRLSFAKAIEQNLLSDYKVIIVALDEAEMEIIAEEYKISMREKNRKDNNGIIDAEKIGSLESKDEDVSSVITAQIAAEVLGTWKALSGIDFVDILDSGSQVKSTEDGSVKAMRSAVAFSNTIKESERIKKSFKFIQEYFETNYPKESKRFSKILIEHVDGTMNDRLRRQKLQWLKDATDGDGIDKLGAPSCKVLSNARCLTEGVDVPTLDAVVFFKERKSIVDIVQAVGRVMRKAKDKEYGYIILPVCIPSHEVPDYDKFMSSDKVFNRIWSVVKALRAHDESLAIDAYFRQKIMVVHGKSPQDSIHGKSNSDTSRNASSRTAQGALPFPIKDISDAIYAAIPNKLGDRGFLRQWASEIGDIATKIAGTLEVIFSDGKNKKSFEDFLTSLRTNLNPSIKADEAIDMLAQHIITRPIFEMMFSKQSFVSHNPISKSLQKIIDDLDTSKFSEQTAKLKKFYADVEKKAVFCSKNEKAKQELIRELYDGFFKVGFPKMSKRLGIAYTPIDVIDFTLKSAAHVLQEELGHQLGDENIHIIDPFTGTGSFIVRLLQLDGLINDEQVTNKFRNEIHANEILLLPYYVALANIVSAYQARLPAGTEYEPFPGMVLTDSFQLYEALQPGFSVDSFSPDNSKRARKQRQAHIEIIIGNPPWSAGQGDDNDDNKNLDYPKLNKRIKDTYTKASGAHLKASLKDSYIQAIRWSSDRIESKGVIAFVISNGWLNGHAASGLRACLAEEFDAIWVVNLRGNARKSSGKWQIEGDKIFGSSSRQPVALVFLVKNPNNKRAKADIFYHDIGDFLSRKEKLDILKRNQSIANINFKKITPDIDNDWIDQRDRRFDKFIEIGSKQGKSGTPGFNPTIFRLYSNGVKTNRDFWTYHFSKEDLTKSMSQMIDFYNQQINVCHSLASDNPKKADDYRDNNACMISWDATLRKSLVKKVYGKFNPENIRPSLYRPFVWKYLYFDRQFNNSVYRQPNFFPSPNLENLAIVISGNSANEFSVLMTTLTPCFDLTSKSQCFPRFVYDNNGTKDDNITEAGVDAFRKHYKNSNISVDEIFFYCYGLLHANDYKTAFASNLVKQLPRLPFANDFYAFSHAGRELSRLHTEYESVSEYPLTLTDNKGNPVLNELQENAGHFRVREMKWADKKSKSRIIYNEHFSLDGIPPDATKYIVNSRTPLDWIINQCKVDARAKNGIDIDVNNWFPHDPCYLISLIKRITTISIDTNRIINSLPPSL